jgi:hypothetical protein
MIMETLTPESPRWEEFIEQLNAAPAEDGCAGDASDDTHCHAKVVMRDMGGVGIESNLAYFEDHGGEIILNVATGDEKCLNDGYVEITDEEYHRSMRPQ